MAVRGTFVGVSVQHPRPVSASDVLGTDVTLPPAELVAQGVTIDVKVEEVRGASTDLVGKIVGFPIVLWFGGDAGPAREDLIATIAASLTQDGPIDAETVLFGKGLQADGERLVVEPPLDAMFGALASVVFVSRDQGLWGLDWTIGDDAESYYGATSAAELMAITERKSA